MPASMWTTSSANASTSAGSWVMRTIGSARRACSSASSARRRLRSGSSSAAKGSSRSSARGSPARARASATRWRWPPESWSGKALGEAAQLERVEPAVDRRAAAVAARIAPAGGRGRRRCSGAP
jgi:hypothetical protein